MPEHSLQDLFKAFKLINHNNEILHHCIKYDGNVIHKKDLMYIIHYQLDMFFITY